MTREDARHYLQSSGFSEEQIATIEQAFKQEPSSDLIRRTDLLDMVEDMTDQFGIKHRVITEGMISLLPSVNSQSCEDAISRKALKHKLQEHHDFFVNAYGGFSNFPQNDKSRVDEILNCIAMVVNEPSVKPQEKTGHWIWQTEDIYQCSECGEDIHVKEVMNKPQYAWCPICGCPMEIER